MQAMLTSCGAAHSLTKLAQLPSSPASVPLAALGGRLSAFQLSRIEVLIPCRSVLLLSPSPVPHVRSRMKTWRCRTRLVVVVSRSCTVACGRARLWQSRSGLTLTRQTSSCRSSGEARAWEGSPSDSQAGDGSALLLSRKKATSQPGEQNSLGYQGSMLASRLSNYTSADALCTGLCTRAPCV